VLANARKKRGGGLPAGQPTSAGGGDPLDPSADPSLRLELAAGRLGLELTRPVSVAAGVLLADLAFAFEDVRFPVDLSGGVRRFRHLRGVVRRAKLVIELQALSAHLSRRVPKQLVAGDERPQITLVPLVDGVAVGLRSSEAALAFDVLVAPDGAAVRLIVERARGLSLPDAPHTLALGLVAGLLPRATRSGSVFTWADPLHDTLLEVLPGAGARVPATAPVRLGFGVDDGGARISLTAVDVPSPLSSRTLRALETGKQAERADDSAFRGDRDLARAAYLDALERAPRHPELTRRLAEIDVAEGRHEAATGSVLEVETLVSAGPLGGRLLEHLDEAHAAYAAFARAAAEEPTPGLAAHAWLAAARVAPDRSSRAAALDEALLRWPRLPAARWSRARERLLAGDARGALSDVEHLEASALDRVERSAIARDAAGLFADRGFLDDAERLFERAVRFEPRDPSAVAGLARALRERGRFARALDLLARACSLAEQQGVDASPIEVDLAEALVAYTDDRPNAIARVGNIGPDRLVAPRARLLEARWRQELGDSAGASRAMARLRALAELRLPEPTGRRREASEASATLVGVLREAADFEERVLAEPRGAARTLVLALRLDPSHREAARRLQALGDALGASKDDREELVREGFDAASPARTSAVGASGAAVGGVSPSVDAPQRASEPRLDAGTERPIVLPLDEAEAEERVELLSQRLRADPRNKQTADELATLLESLGRDLELLALLSARVEDAIGVDAVPLTEARRTVLFRLAERAKAEGRLDESELYRSMAEAEL
jgi:tetratricopeptide (TPR) repeat protein